MISLKRLEAMRRWQEKGGSDFARGDIEHIGWAERAGLLRINRTPYRTAGTKALVPTPLLAPAIRKAEAEHTRHRTLEQREVNQERDGDANRARQGEVTHVG